MPNEVTIVCILSACSKLGALQLGRWVYMYERNTCTLVVKMMILNR